MGKTAFEWVEEKDKERRLMDSQEIEKLVIASEAKQSPPWQLADSWGLLRRFAPRNDSLGDFLRGYQAL
jgi:hypothetical protein